MTASLHALVVAYRAADKLLACLDSLATHLPEVPVVVLDNSGDDSSVRELAETYRSPADQEITWLLHGPNIGFAAGVNAAARAAAPGADLLLVNPDAVLLSSLSATRSVIAADRRIAAAAPQIHENSATHRTFDTAHRAPSWARSVVSFAGYSHRLRGRWCSDLYASAPSTVSGYLTGACLLLNRQCFDELGGFDESFFLYGEEVDYQQRALKAGYTLRFVDEPGIAHSSGGTVAGNTAGSSRSRDLQVAHVATVLQRHVSTAAANGYLVCTDVLERLQRSKRRALVQRRTAATTGLPEVIMTTNTLCRGGAERQHAVLTSGLIERGYPTTVVCVQAVGQIVAEIAPGVRIIRRPWWWPFFTPLARRQVIISDTTNTETGFAALFRLLRTSSRWIVASHNPIPEDSRFFSRFLEYAGRRADAMITLSDHHRTEIDRHHNFDGVPHNAVPNALLAGADVETVRASSADALQQLEQRREADAPWRLVTLSRLEPVKQVDVLFAALATGVLGENFHLDVYGDGSGRARLEQSVPAELRDRVTFHGWVAGPEQAFSGHDVLCVPSRYEAFPLTILEAFQRGVVVAASPVGSVPEMLDHGGCGVLASAPTVDGWADALRQLAQLSAADLAELGRAGLDKVTSQYTIDTMVDGYISVIESVKE